MSKEQPNALPFKQAIVNKVASAELSEVTLDSLLTMQSRVLANKVPRKTLTTGYPAIAAAVLVLVCAVVILQITRFESPPAEEIAQEVVKNHLTLKPLDIQTSSFVSAQRFFQQLDFTPVPSVWMNQSSFASNNQLLGGRYCSVKGVKAAQLRYQKTALQPIALPISTLYQVPYDQKQHGALPHIERGEVPQKVNVGDLGVTLWIENDLLMVLVSE